MAQAKRKCPYWNAVRDPRGEDVPCGSRVRDDYGSGTFTKYCDQCRSDFATKYASSEEIAS